MKILMIARKTLKTSPGGDTVQILSTAKYLRNLGVVVDVFAGEGEIEYKNYDLLHFFNVIRPDDILSHIFKSQLPFVISTIFVDYSEYERNRGGKLGLLLKIFNGDQIEYIKALARYIKNGDKINSKFYLLNGHKASIKYVANKAMMLLPNSDNEYKRFVEQYSTKTSYKKVVNAVDLSTFSDSILPNEEFRNHIVCVGRIEGRKNQLNLIKALMETDLYLTIIGKPSPNHIGYFNECVELVATNKRMRIIEHIDHKELAGIFKAAKVHVLPSWFETTGLSSLEAAIMGCNIVVTPKGDTVEYFKNLAHYCQPNDIASIKKAVLEAYHAPSNESLKALILADYTWEKTAEQTLDAYKVILEK